MRISKDLIKGDEAQVGEWIAFRVARILDNEYDLLDDTATIVSPETMIPLREGTPEMIENRMAERKQIREQKKKALNPEPAQVMPINFKWNKEEE